MDKITKLSKGIGKRLIKLRKERNKTQEEVILDIKEHNLSLRSLKSYENGRTQIELEKLVILAEYYEASLDYLVYGHNTVNMDSYTWETTLKMLGRLLSSFVLFPQKIDDPNDVYNHHYQFQTLDVESVVYIDKCLSLINVEGIVSEGTGKENRIDKIFDDAVSPFKDLPGSTEMTSKRMNRIKEYLEVKNYGNRVNQKS